MKKKKNWIFGLVVAAFIVVIVSVGECAATEGDVDTEDLDWYQVYDVGGKPVGQKTLAGITSLYLSIDVKDVKLLQDKFNETQLYLDVLKKVRQENIRTLSLSEVVKTQGPMLSIRVKVKSISAQTCAYSISVSVRQAVTLNRDPNESYLAVTWWIPELPGCSSKQELASVVEHLVKDGLEVFTLEHLRANIAASLEELSLDVYKEKYSDSGRIVQVLEEELEIFKKMGETLFVVGTYAFREKVNFSTGDERERDKNKKMLRLLEKEYERWRNSTLKEVEALIMEVTAIGREVEEGELERDRRELILKKMQELGNYAQKKLKSIRGYENLEGYQGELAGIRDAYQKLSEASSVVINKIKKVK